MHSVGGASLPGHPWRMGGGFSNSGKGFILRLQIPSSPSSIWISNLQTPFFWWGEVSQLMGSIPISCVFHEDEIICLASSTFHNSLSDQCPCPGTQTTLHVSLPCFPCIPTVSFLFGWRQVNNIGDQKELLLQQKLPSSMNPVCCPDVPCTPRGPCQRAMTSK